MKLKLGSLHRVIELSLLKWEVEFTIPMALTPGFAPKHCCLQSFQTMKNLCHLIFPVLWSEGFPPGVWILLKVPTSKPDRSQSGSGFTGHLAWGPAADCWVWSPAGSASMTPLLSGRALCTSQRFSRVWLRSFSQPRQLRASARCATCSPPDLEMPFTSH